MKRVLVVAASVGMLGLLGCPVKSGLGTRCDLPRRSDGGPSFLTEGEVQELTGTGKMSTRDFIAFGAVDCEDFVCVRDSSFPRGTDLSARAQGYCSKPCLVGSTCPSDDPNDDTKLDKKLSCRPLLLDEATLAALQMNGLGKSIGNVKEPFFCARGSLPVTDAGM